MDYYDTDEGKRAIAHYLAHLNGRDVSRRHRYTPSVVILFLFAALLVMWTMYK